MSNKNNTIILGILSLCLFILSACGNSAKNVPAGYVDNGNGGVVQLGPHHNFLDVLHNGDSLYEYYFIDSANGWEHNHIYYTSNMGKTQNINWNTGGKFSKLESNLQH